MTGGQLLAVALVVLVAAAAQMVSGFGFALMAVPLMGLAIDLKTAVVVCTICGTASNTFQAMTDRGHRDSALALRLILASLAGMPFGWLLLEAASNDQLRVVVGLTVLAALVILSVSRLSPDIGPVADVLAGVVSGALAIATSTNGPPLVLLMRAKKMRPEVFRATINTVFSVVAVVSIVVFVSSGRVDSAVLKGAACAVPGLVVGIVAGQRIRSRLNEAFFWRLVLVLLVGSAVASIASGLY